MPNITVGFLSKCLLLYQSIKTIGIPMNNYAILTLFVILTNVINGLYFIPKYVAQQKWFTLLKSLITSFGLSVGLYSIVYTLVHSIIISITYFLISTAIGLYNIESTTQA